MVGTQNFNSVNFEQQLHISHWIWYYRGYKDESNTVPTSKKDSLVAMNTVGPYLFLVDTSSSYSSVFGGLGEWGTGEGRPGESKHSCPIIVPQMCYRCQLTSSQMAWGCLPSQVVSILVSLSWGTEQIFSKNTMEGKCWEVLYLKEMMNEIIPLLVILTLTGSMWH